MKLLSKVPCRHCERSEAISIVIYTGDCFSLLKQTFAMTACLKNIVILLGVLKALGLLMTTFVK